MIGFNKNIYQAEMPPSEKYMFMGGVNVPRIK